MYTNSRGKKYKTIKILGRGAFAEVYQVEDAAGQQYACKVCEHAELLSREGGFQRETEHPLFPAVLDFWREGSTGYLLMEYVPGESLENILRREGAFSDRRAAEIGCRLAEGLLYLHEKKELLFRDVKPANVMLTPEGTVKLLDFGCVCRFGKNVDRAGTPGFGAPEQFEVGEMQTAAADVYGLGRTLQEITEGRCRGLLKRITDKCTADSPKERLPNMREAEDLLPLCAGERKTRINARQRAILRGEIRVVKDICCR